MYLHETLLCSTSAPPNSGTGSLTLHDIQTGTAMASFKQTNAASHCSDCLQSTSSRGGFILAAQPDKSILNVYNFKKDGIALKIVLPEKLTCLALDTKGIFCAGGTTQGRIFLWETSSGIMFNAWDAHYRAVSVLKFTTDGAALISGSEDSMVNVWSVDRLIENDLQSNLPVAECTLSDHTLPITDIICGVGVYPHSRLLTSSLDHTVKIWDLSSKSLLATFQFPKSIISLAWDITERFFFAASEDGDVHQCNLYRTKANSRLGGLITEAVSGGGATDIIRVEEENSKSRVIVVSEGVSSLAISLTSSLLVVGSLSGSIQIFDIPSHQLLRTISTHKGTRITYLATMLKPPDLVGHISLHMNANNTASNRDTAPVLPVLPFQRIRDPKARESHQVTMILPNREHTNDDGDYALSEELAGDHAFFVQPSANGQQITTSLQSKVTDLETEAASLREQLGKAKGINDAMWEGVVKRVVNDAFARNRKTSDVNGMDVEIHG